MASERWRKLTNRFQKPGYFSMRLAFKINMTIASFRPTASNLCRKAASASFHCAVALSAPGHSSSSRMLKTYSDSSVKEFCS